MTTRANVQKLPGSGEGGRKTVFLQNILGQMGPVWHDRQRRVILKMTLAAVFVGSW